MGEVRDRSNLRGRTALQPSSNDSPGKKKPKKPKNPVGRPTDYDPNLHPWLVEAWASAGLTEPEIAAKLGKADSTLRAWKKYPEFSAALKRGKQLPDDRVERSLYQRATGYSYPSEKVFQFEGSIVRAPVTEHCPPDVTACIFWLKNRRRDQWRDKQDHEVTGANGSPLCTPTMLEVIVVGSATIFPKTATEEQPK